MEYEKLKGLDAKPEPRTKHPDQIYSPVGPRVGEDTVAGLVTGITDLALQAGYPGKANDEARITFDRRAASHLRAAMDLTWADAGNYRLWSFISLVALPHLTSWRFPGWYVERWICTDLARHTWARLWWQATVFDGSEGLLDLLNESDLNALLERPSIGGDSRLVQSLAAAVLANKHDIPRRGLIRDSAKRLIRLLAFVEPRALGCDEVAKLCNEVVAESANHLRPPA